MTWKIKLNIYEVSYGLIHNYVVWFKIHDQSSLNYNSMEVEKPSIVGFIRYSIEEYELDQIKVKNLA